MERPGALYRTRLDLLDQEARDLAPYALRSAESAGRRHPESEDPHRPAYARDRDRIVHSGAFRRLEYKTQVVLSGRGDNFRTRLTHTLEVAQIARSAARTLGLNEALVEALALAHDLGHPPFGHTGEDALRDRMRLHCPAEETPFEHNLQALRIVDLLECPYPGRTGLNLCKETREGILKHGMRRAGRLAADLRSAKQPWLEAQLVDVADSIAYHSHDVDDGLRFGVVRVEDLGQLELWRRAHDAARSLYPTASADELRRAAIHHLLHLPVLDLLEHSRARIAESGITAPDEARALDQRLLAFSADMARMQKEMRSFLFEHFYRASQVVKDRELARRVLEELFDHLLEHPEHVRTPRGDSARELSERRGEPLARIVCDYVAGMTDRFAWTEHEQRVRA